MEGVNNSSRSAGWWQGWSCSNDLLGLLSSAACLYDSDGFQRSLGLAHHAACPRLNAALEQSIDLVLRLL